MEDKESKIDQPMRIFNVSSGYKLGIDGMDVYHFRDHVRSGMMVLYGKVMLYGEGDGKF
jgi:hypothetical protein